MAFTLPGAGGSTAPLLRDVFNIPEYEGDTFVLKLAESVERDSLDETVRDYVVTDEIAGSLGTALSFVEKGLSSGDNQGIYLSGSFGSGKSHFMAVLYALLSGAPVTREIAELQPLVSAHPAAINANLLQLPFHFLDSTSIEDTLFRGYLEHVARLHPDASAPVLHSSETLFRDADNLRSTMGDQAFFAALNGAKTRPEGATRSAALADSGIDFAALGGAPLAGEWDSVSYGEGRASSATEKVREALAAALTETLFTSYAAHSSWLGLAEGMSVMSTHAKSLGYEGVVLYLDELILWLTFLVPSRERFNQEAQKLTLLVESKLGQMAVPMISIVARQHDLGTWQDTSIEAGADVEARQRAFAHQEGRFHNLELGNRNLPLIANKRLLTPKNHAAELELDQAFDRLNLRSEISNVLLDGVNTSEEHRASDMEAFRLTYPFSPALVDTLMHLAPAMQRERTGLKVMESLLVSKRDTMRIDSVIPVGDAFDHVIDGSQHIQNSQAEVFRKGQAFWRDKLRPFIYRKAGVDPSTPESEVPPYVKGHLRVGKTLILSALAPGVPALKAITASRLAHLNHGSMVEVFAGDAVSSTLSEVRGWAAQFPEILIQEGSQDPVITLKLEEVPWEEVIRGAQIEDTASRRQARVRTELAKALQVHGLNQQADGAYSRSVVWRGTPRTVEVIFGNVRDERELVADAFLPSTPDALRLVIDLPLDETGHTIAEDHQRIGALQEQSGSSPFTIAWLPQFLPAEHQTRLGELVIIDHVLQPNGWRDHTSRLSEDVKEAVRQVLAQRQKTLEGELRRHISTAYGVTSGATFPEGQPPLRSLDPSVTVRQQTGATLEEAADRLIEAALSARYPDHPLFESTSAITATDVNRVIGALRRAAGDANGRADLEPEARKAARILLTALNLAGVGESHLVFNQDTAGSVMTAIETQLRSENHDSTGVLQVQALRNAVAGINPRQGLSPLIIDLHVAAWAAYRNRSWYHHNQLLEHTPRVQEITPRMELHPVELPDSTSWDAALEVAGGLFGLFISPGLNSNNLFQLRDGVAEKVAERHNDAQAMSTQLSTVFNRLNHPHRTSRGELAEGLTGLLDRLHRDSGNAQRTVAHLADAVTGKNRILGASPQEANEALNTAGDVTTALRRLLTGSTGQHVTTLQSYAAQRPGNDGGAAIILNRLVSGLSDHQFKTNAKSVVDRFEEEVARWIADVITPPPPPPPPPPPFPPVVFEKVTSFSVVEEKLRDLGVSPSRPVKVTIEFLDPSEGTR